MGHKRKRKTKNKYNRKRARVSSTSSRSTRSSSSEDSRSRTPPLTASRKRSKVSHMNDAINVSTINSTLHNMIPDFEPLRDNVVSWLNVIESNASTFSWTDSMIRYQALNKLKGSAKVWYESLLRNDYSWTNWLWKDWKQKISNAFRVKRNMFELLKDIIDRKPVENQSLYDFFFEQKAKIDSLGLNFMESDIISIILGNIGDSNITASIEASNFKSCDSLAGFLHSRVYKPRSAKQVVVSNVGKPILHAPNPITRASGSVITVPAENSAISSQQLQSRKPLECYNCGGNHKRIQCTIKCEFCGKKGHTEAICFHKKKMKLENEQKTDKQEIKYIKTTNTKDKFCKKVYINGIIADAFIDTGSSCSIISSEAANGMNLRRYSLNYPVMLQGFSKDSLRMVKEIVRVNIKLDSVDTKDVEMYILDEISGCNILLGRNITELPSLMYVRLGDSLTFQKVDNLGGFCNTVVDSDLLFDANSNHDELRKLFITYDKCIAMNIRQLGKVNGHEMVINLQNDKPVYFKPYRTSNADRQVVRDMINELLQNDIIRESHSAYASPALLVGKKNGEKRLCIDYRALNKITILDKYPMPRIEDLIDRLQGSTIFTSLDLKSGYYQIIMSAESIHKTAFITEDGHYEFLRLPFGLVNAPSCFQQMMNKIMGNLRFGKVILYFDDILLISESVEENLKLLETVLQIFKEHGLTINLKKCHFLKTEIEFLGYKINSEGVRPSENKINAITKFPAPKTVHQLRQFLGLISYFRKFIKNCALMTSSLTRLLKKDCPWSWNSDHENAFITLKEILSSDNVLTLFDPTKQSILYTDASRDGIAGILMQVTEQGEKPIHYYSRQTNEDEKKYHSFELELLAIVQSLTKFRHYLLGSNFRIVTDCNAVRYTLTKKEIIPRIARWILSTQEFAFEIVHREGTRMQHVDALSRNPLHSGQKSEAEIVMSITESDWLLSVQLQDPKLIQIRNILESGEVDKHKDVFHKYQLLGNKVYRSTNQGRRWVVPKNCIWQVIKSNHDDLGHFSVDKTVERILSRYWFPRIHQTVKKYIKNCINCIFYKSKGGPKEGELYPLPKYAQPFHTLHLDHLGPFVETAHRNKYILVTVDAFTKFVFIAAVQNTESANVISELNNVAKIFGYPKRLITDAGSAFTSKVFKEYCANKNIRLHTVATGMPRSNGQVERFNKTILDAIRTMGADLDESNWDRCITQLQQAINSTYQKTIKAVPSEVFFGYRLRTNSDIIGPEPEIDDESTIDMTKLREQVVKNTRDSGDYQKQIFDRKHAKPKQYNKGELVLLRVQSNTNDGRSRKLLPVYKGPFQIKKSLGHDRYEVRDMRGSERSTRAYNGIAAAENMKPWINIDNWRLD